MQGQSTQQDHLVRTPVEDGLDVTRKEDGISMTNEPTATVSGATSELRELDVFAGRWRTQGRVVASAAEEELEIVGTDAYEWLPGGYFMLHRVDVSIGEGSVRTLEVIGYDPVAKHYPTRFFDHRGNTGTYEATISDGVWTFSTDGARATLEIDPSLTRMEAKWERLVEGVWERWMELEFTKPRKIVDRVRARSS
jgi:hypothetical protein